MEKRTKACNLQPNFGPAPFPESARQGLRVTQNPMPSLTSACFRATGLALTCVQPDAALQSGSVRQRQCLGTIPASLPSTGLSHIISHVPCCNVFLEFIHSQLASSLTPVFCGDTNRLCARGRGVACVAWPRERASVCLSDASSTPSEQ